MAAVIFDHKMADKSELFCSSLVLVAAYQWLVCYLLKESAAKLQQELSNGKVVHDPLNFFRLFKWQTLKVGDG